MEANCSFLLWQIIATLSNDDQLEGQKQYQKSQLHKIEPSQRLFSFK